jgi:hypothetical protein
LRLGKTGYRNIVRFFDFDFCNRQKLTVYKQMTNLTTTSDWLAEKIASIEDAHGKVKFEILGDNLGGKGLPLVAWKLKHKENYDGTSTNWVYNSSNSSMFLTLYRVRDCAYSAFSWMDRYANLYCLKCLLVS